MTKSEDIIKKIRDGNFRENNGQILRTFNILPDKYIALKDIKYAIPNMQENDFTKSLDFLQEEGYLRLRDIETRNEVLLADSDMLTLEAKLTGKGSRLLNGGIPSDNMVEI